MPTVFCTCGEGFHVADQHIGRRIQCGRCGRRFEVEKPPEARAYRPEPEPRRAPPPPRDAYRDQYQYRNDPPPREAYRGDSYRDDPYRSDSYHGDPYRNDRGDAYRGDRGDSYRQDPYRSDSYRSEPSRDDSYRDDSYRSDPYRNDPYRRDSTVHREEWDGPREARYSGLKANVQEMVGFLTPKVRLYLFIAFAIFSLGAAAMILSSMQPAASTLPAQSPADLGSGG